MRSILFSLLLISISALSFAQSGEAYKLYTSSGDEVQLDDMVKALAKTDVLCFGELHNDPIVHWLQLELTKAVAQDRSVILGAEMFETDDQLVLNEYLAGRIKEDHLKTDAKLWPNYKTDYRSLVEWAKENQVPFIATNAPRRYASLVSREGIEGLSKLDDAAKALLPALPFEVRANDRGYAEMVDMMGGGHGHGMNMDYLIAAQALKDYTMASNVMKHRDKKALFIHYNGSFHSQYRDGMAGYLRDMDPKIDLVVIASTSADALDFDEEWKGLGDYILVTPSSMTKTH
jgi:uncharacterized iron-regulated protein